MSTQRLSDETLRQELRQLELVDRILGLEAENSRLAILVGESSGPRSGHDRLQSELAVIYTSRTWRVGRAVLAPGRVLRSVARRLLPKQQ